MRALEVTKLEFSIDSNFCSRWQSSVGNYSVTGVIRTSDASIGGGRILGKTKNMASPFFGKNSELCLAMLLFLVSRNLNLSARSRTSPRGPRLTQHVVTRVAGQIDLEAKNHC